MNETLMLIGSLSNDLLRVANMVHRGSVEGASRFFNEAQKWSLQLKHRQLKPYIQNIITGINAETNKTALTKNKAEKFLMYSILLQNYAVHDKFE